jgi:hypothetical protein
LRAFFILAFIAVGVLGEGTPAQANLLVNGDFEDPGTSVTTNYQPFTGGNNTTNNTTIPGWYLRPNTSNGSSPTIFYTQSTPSDPTSASWIPNAQSGEFLMQLDSTNSDASWTQGSSLYQIFTATAGTFYELSFWINTEVGSGKGGTSAIILNVGTLSGDATTGAIGTGYISDETFTVTNPANVARANAVWQQHTIYFTATASGDTVLRFADSPTSSNSNISIDNVVLVVVPEPAVVASGLLLLGLIAWRERRRFLPQSVWS